MLNNNNVEFGVEWPKVLYVLRNMLNNKNVSRREWQDMFSINNQIISWVSDGDKLLLIELKREIEYHVRHAAMNIHSNSDENSLLKAYIAEWDTYLRLTGLIPKPFQMIERQTKCSLPTIRKSEAPQIVRTSMLECWNRIVFSSISNRLLNAAMSLIERERNGELVDSKLVIGVRESFVYLNVKSDNPLEMYTRDFERNYLDDIERFYKSLTSNILQENGVLNYMEFADEKLSDEENRAKKYLDFTLEESNTKLMEKLVNVLIIEYQEQFLAEGPRLIASNEIKRLNMMYRLINRTPNGIQTLLETLSRHIKSEGLNAMKANAETILTDSEKFVEQLLSMYNVFSGLVRDAFANDPRFLTVRDQAFQEVVNNTDVFRLELNVLKNRSIKSTSVESKCPELLANYCDLLLRKSVLTKRFTSEEIDERLNNVLLVLKYVANKDVFMRYHKTHLSRRLILELVADQEKEETLVNKFREAGMPADYVNKLFRMLQDIEVNKDLNSAFRKSISAAGIGNTMTDFVNIKILNAGAWSRGKDRSNLTLPHELDNFIPEVEEFYRKQHSGRKLNWAHHWSTGVISFVNKMGKYDIEVTTYQMAVLFAWNERPTERISFENLRLTTTLTDAELNRTLLSLVSYPKLKSQILLTDGEPVGPVPPTTSLKCFNDSTQFWINQNFSVIKNDRPQPRGKINLIGRLQLSSQADGGGASGATLAGVADDEHTEILQLRVYRVQEAIVKIMKMRKQLTQAQLHTELVEVLKHMFLPSKKLIKEQIEWLIEQRYLTRDEEDINRFTYVT